MCCLVTRAPGMSADSLDVETILKKARLRDERAEEVTNKRLKKSRSALLHP